MLRRRCGMHWMESRSGGRRRRRHKRRFSRRRENWARDSLESLALLFCGDSLMAKAMPIGARATVEETVEFKHTLTSHHPELPPVYSTPDMIRLMETAAFHTLQPYCEGDEITVGTSIHVEHRAASGIGAKIRAEAVLEPVAGRFYTVRVTAWDDAREIGRGTVGRAVVSMGKFLKKYSS